MAHPDIDARIDILDKKITQNPNDAMLYLKRGNLHRQHRDWEAALADFKSATSIAPDLPDVFYYRSLLWFDAGQPTRAHELIDRFLAIQPSLAQGFIVRSRIRTELRQYLNASEDLTTALKLVEKPLPDLYVERARLLKKAGPAYRDKMRRGLEEGLKRLGPLVSLIDLLVELEAEDGHYQRALEYMDILPQAVQQQPGWISRRGDIYFSAGKKQEAVSNYEQFLVRIAALPENRRDISDIRELEQRVREQLTKLHATMRMK